MIVEIPKNSTNKYESTKKPGYSGWTGRCFRPSTIQGITGSSQEPLRPMTIRWILWRWWKSPVFRAA